MATATIDYELQKLIRMLPGYDPLAQAGDCWFDEDAAGSAIEFIESYCTFTKGSKGGQRFILEDWEKAIVANLFGWKQPDNRRRFRECLLFVPRKNGKSELAAAILVYVIFTASGAYEPAGGSLHEPGAEIYGAAGKRDQTKYIFTPVKKMILAEPKLAAAAKIYQHSIVVGDASYLKISSEATTEHGGSTHCAVIDELHAQATPELVDVLLTSMASRDEPLILHVTTSDYEREGSICNDKHEHACKVRDGIIEDRAFLPVIYEANMKPHSEFIQVVDFARRLDILCSCKTNTAPTTSTVKLLQEACAGHAILGGIKPTDHLNTGAKSTLTDQSGLEGCVRPAMSNGCSTTTPSTKPRPSLREPSGPPAIVPVVTKLPLSGEQNQPTSGLSPKIGEKLSMAYPARNMARCETPRTGDVLSAELPETYASITATIREWLGDCSVPLATRESACLEILPILCSTHSTTCSVHKATRQGSLVRVDVAGDDWTCPEVWAKANPNLGVSVRLDHIERECKRAQSDPAYENTFKRLHLNIRTEQAFRLIQMIHWDACDKPVEIPDGAAVTIGLDGASVQDMASAVVCYFDGDDYHLEPYYFCPEAQVVEMEARGDSLYRGWVTEGLLIATPGNSIDDRAIRKKLNELASQYDVREVPYDPYNLTTFATQVLEEDGIPMVEHRQGDISMNEPMKAMIRLMLNGNIRHGAHPILRWNASNLAAKENPSGNIRPDKAKSAGKIDGIVGAIMAIGRADKDSGDSFYETNRLETTDG